MSENCDSMGKVPARICTIRIETVPAFGLILALFSQLYSVPEFSELSSPPHVCKTAPPLSSAKFPLSVLRWGKNLPKKQNVETYLIYTCIYMYMIDPHRHTKPSKTNVKQKLAALSGIRTCTSLNPL